MSLTEKQRLANRENAQKSTGPNTPEGKQRSSMNGIRHGLCSRVVVLPHEDMQAYNAFRQQWFDEYKPQAITETQLVQRLCDCQWRLNRSASYEDGIYAVGHSHHGDSVDTGSPEIDNTILGSITASQRANDLNNLSRHEARVQKQFDSTFKQLRELQAERKHREKSELESAVSVYKVKQILGEEFIPHDFGFALSAPEITQAARLAHCLHQAEIAKKVNYNKAEFLKMTQ
jgi:hypothetical protein